MKENTEKNNFLWDTEEECYVISDKLSNNQFIEIQFQEEWTSKKFFYNVYLTISNKRKSKDNNFKKTTGKCGLEGLLWAKNKIIDFEDFIKESDMHNERPVYVYVQWDDNRRRNTYERGLKNLGYKYSYVEGRKALMKQIQ